MLWRLSRALGLRPRRIAPAERQRLVVVVTGCDSGVGYAAALEALRSGLTVVACFLSGARGAAAERMLAECGDDGLDESTAARLLPTALDVADERSVDALESQVRALLDENPDYALHAVVNNAAVMVFGRFEWLTRAQIDAQLAVNARGPMLVTRALLPLLLRGAAGKRRRASPPRLVVVSSHCAEQPLPALSAYAASKCALRGWCEALRMELRGRGVRVVELVPGSLVAATNIAARQLEHARAMRDARAFADNRAEEAFERFMAHIAPFCSAERPPNGVRDAELMDKFMAALLETNPSAEYKHQPWRYAIYHFLFAWAPMGLRHWLVGRFVSFPELD